MKRFSVFGMLFRTVLALVMIAALMACGKKSDSTNSDASTAPTLPPYASLAMDFSSFPSSTTAAPALTSALSTTFGWSNFTYSYVNVAVWNAIITVGLAVPVLTFAESFNHTPVLQSDGSWLWSYTKTVSDVLYTAKLYGKLSGSQVTWKMYISKAGDYTDFNWFNGTADLTTTSGSWTMYESPANPVELLSINWDRTSATTGNITYTNVKAGDANNGGYISYGNSGSTDPAYGAYYTIYNISAGDLINIEWNTASKDGRVKSPTAFGDSNWHYWDSLLQDVP